MATKKQNLIKGPVLGFKGTDKNMKCNDFQFVMGMNVLGGDEPLVLCQHGFHFCQQPSGPFAYKTYARIFRVKAYDVLESPWEPGADYKLVCGKVEFLDEVVIDGDSNTGYSNTGFRNTGFRNTGNGNTGDSNTGYSNTGFRNTGNRNTGYSNTGYSNTGYSNTGFRNTGYRNAGDRNTGNSNAGNDNTGNRNTGYGNVSNDSAGYFCRNEPPILFFDLPVELSREELDWSLISKLGRDLGQKKSFDYEQYLQLPNATVSRIKALHKAHIAARKDNK